jgi:hypothetical protein
MDFVEIYNVIKMSSGLKHLLRSFIIRYFFGWGPNINQSNQIFSARV